MLSWFCRIRFKRFGDHDAIEENAADPSAEILERPCPLGHAARHFAFAQYAAVHTRSWAVDSMNGRVRLKAEKDRLLQELALRNEETRIKDARMARIAPHRRPHYPPTERMAILELRTARGWSLEQTARTFQVTSATIASWMKRVDEEGPDALVQLREPVNKFPDFVRYVVRRLKVLCPAMGKKKMAQTLARAGLHLGTTTVGRMLKEKPASGPEITEECKAVGRVVTSKYPNHVWLVDLTVVPTGSGLWCSWLPFALPQQWPFCHWVALVMDHSSRRAMGVGVFADKPSCRELCTFLGRAVRRIGAAPKYIVCDRDSIFDCNAFRRWVKRKGIQPPRYGAVGKHGSIALVERLILTTKQTLRLFPTIPLRRDLFRRELTSILYWYNEHRPHTSLAGKTPNEAYRRVPPANRQPRIEPRRRWPRRSPCAQPGTLVAGRPGDRFHVRLDYHAGRRQLPVVTLKRAA